VIITVSVSFAVGIIAVFPSHLTVKPVLPGNQFMTPDVYANENTHLQTVPVGILARLERFTIVAPAMAALVTKLVWLESPLLAGSSPLQMSS
jgi:hypothetical protein